MTDTARPIRRASTDDSAARRLRVRGYWQSVGYRLRHDPVTLCFGAVVLLIVLAAIFAPLLAPFDPYKESVVAAAEAVRLARPSARHRRTRPRHAEPADLRRPVVAADGPGAGAASPPLLGGTLGVIGGFAGGRVNAAIMRTMDVFYAFPSVLLAVAISGAMGGGMANGMLALALVFIPPMCRVAETATTQVRSLDFIEAARATGAGTLTIIRYHVLGNVLGPVFIYASSLVSVSILLASGLSFLGLGVKPPTPDWGLMLSTLRQSIYVVPLSCALPGAGDLRHLDLLQPGQRRHARGDGCADVSDGMSSTPIRPRDRGGPAQPLLIARDLRKHFQVSGARQVGRVRAVDGVSFTLFKGETLGIVGESGCGKSTLARLLLHLVDRDAGELIFDGEPVGAPRGITVAALRRQVQMVFQDSYSSLNPRMPVAGFGGVRPVRAWPQKPRRAARRARHAGKVGLDPDLFGPRYPHELSGGQKQRVNIARALAIEPRMVILDEAVSALDKSVEAQVLNLLRALKQQFNLTYLFISHDLNVVRYISDRVLVMYLGRVVELGPVRGDLRPRRCIPTRARCSASRPSMDPAQPHRGAADHRRSAEPDRSAVRLPLPHALPVRRGGVRGDDRRSSAPGWTRNSHVAACHMLRPGLRPLHGRHA